MKLWNLQIFAIKKFKVKISGNWEILNTKVFKIKIENRKFSSEQRNFDTRKRERWEWEEKFDGKISCCAKWSCQEVGKIYFGKFLGFFFI